MATIPSLALIPSGYKASKVYSVLPTDGTGDFDFTRSGNATRVNSDGLIELVGSNVPRLNYPLIDGVVQGCPSLLLEPERQNVCLWSEQINNAGWGLTNAPTITTNIATAPDGYGGADGIQDTTGGTFKRIRQNFSVSANSTNTASVFVKKETTQTNFGGLAFTCTGGTTKFAYGIINPIDGTIVVSSDSVIGATSTKVEDYGDWWRFSLTATDNGSNTSIEIAYYATISTNGTSTGLGTGSVRTVWGFQLEIGAAYATSYIPTSGTIGTRSAETCNNAGDVNTFNDSEGVLFAEISSLANQYSANSRINISDGTGTNAIRIGYTTTSNQIIAVAAASGVQAAPTYIVNDIKTSNKCAFKYKTNDFALWINGFEVATDTLGTTPTGLNTLDFDLDGIDYFYGNTKQIQYYDSALNDSDLETLTSWDSFSDMAIGQLYSVE